MQLGKLHFKYTLIILTISIVTSCSKTDPTIHQWKHCGETTIGDWIDFKNPTWDIKKDTIYKQGIPVAIIDKIDSRITDKKMELTIIKTKRKCSYCSK